MIKRNRKQTILRKKKPNSSADGISSTGIKEDRRTVEGNDWTNGTVVSGTA